MKLSKTEYENIFDFEKSTTEIAERLFELSKDMDFLDYEEEKEEIINELDNALYNIKAIVQNEYNNDYWRILYAILQKI